MFERVGKLSDFHPLGNSADPADVGLSDVGGPAHKQVFEPVLGVFVLAGGDRDRDGPGDAG